MPFGGFIYPLEIFVSSDASSQYMENSKSSKPQTRISRIVIHDRSACFWGLPKNYGGFLAPQGAVLLPGHGPFSYDGMGKKISPRSWRIDGNLSHKDGGSYSRMSSLVIYPDLWWNYWKLLEILVIIGNYWNTPFSIPYHFFMRHNLHKCSNLKSEAIDRVILPNPTTISSDAAKLSRCIWTMFEHLRNTPRFCRNICHTWRIFMDPFFKILAFPRAQIPASSSPKRNPYLVNGFLPPHLWTIQWIGWREHIIQKSP